MIHAGIADAFEAAGCGFEVGVEYGSGFAAEQQVDVADDAGGDLAWAAFVIACVAGCALGERLGIGAGAVFGDAIDGFGFTQAGERGGAFGAVHRAAFGEYCGDDAMPGADIGAHVFVQIAVVRVIPDVMVRVDDGEVWFECGFGVQGEPLGAHRQMGADGGWGVCFGVHGLPRFGKIGPHLLLIREQFLHAGALLHALHVRHAMFETGYVRLEQ